MRAPPKRRDLTIKIPPGVNRRKAHHDARSDQRKDPRITCYLVSTLPPDVAGRRNADQPLEDALKCCVRLITDHLADLGDREARLEQLVPCKNSIAECGLGVAGRLGEAWYRATRTRARYQIATPPSVVLLN